MPENAPSNRGPRRIRPEPMELNISVRQRHQLRILGRLLPTELNSKEFVMRLIRRRIEKGIVDGDLEGDPIDP